MRKKIIKQTLFASIIVSLIIVLPKLSATTQRLHDPTHRPLKFQKSNKELNKEYPINMIRVNRADRLAKMVQIGSKIYSIGEFVDSIMRVVDIRGNHVVLEDGRHGNIVLHIKKIS